MINEAANDALTKIISQNYTYSSQSRKYFSKEAQSSFSDKASTIEDILNKFSRNYPNEYVSASGNEGELKKTIGELLSDICTAKKAKRASESIKRNVSGELSTGMNSDVETNPLWRPIENFNVVDAAWCEGLYLDPNNTLYKKTENGALKVVQQLCSQNLDKCVRALLKIQNITEPKKFIESKIATLTSIHLRIDSGDMGEKGNVASQLKRPMTDFVTMKRDDVPTLQQWLNLTDDEAYELKSVDELSSKIIYKYLNDMLPASMINTVFDLAKAYNRFPSDKEGKERKQFTGFTYKTKNGAKLTKAAYFKNLLSECSEYLQTIDDRPKAATAADDDTPSFGKFNQELFDQDAEKYGDLTLENSWLNRIILEPMDDDQKDFHCAWYYAMFNRFPMVISKCHQDGGGTWKTTQKAVISVALERYYGADISFPMARGQLHDLPSRYNDRRQISLADCLYCPYDEPDQKGPLWEDFKACTGALTREIMIKILYVNPYMAPTDVLFDIGSNKPIYLTDKSAFQRRIAFIRTTAHDTVASVPKKILEELSKVDKKNGLTDDQLREFHLLMRLGKDAYERIISKYGSMEQAAKLMPSIRAELNDNSPWDDYLTGFYMSLFDDSQTQVKIANDALDERLAGYKAKHRTDLQINHLSLINFIKSVHPENKAKSFKIKKQVVRGWILNKPEIDYTDAEESNFQEIGLDDEGNTIPSIPAPASDYFGGKKYASAKDIPVADPLNLLGEVANEY